jgi:hypothetical protein
MFLALSSNRISADAVLVSSKLNSCSAIAYMCCWCISQCTSCLQHFYILLAGLVSSHINTYGTDKQVVQQHFMDYYRGTVLARPRQYWPLPASTLMNCVVPSSCDAYYTHD